MVSSAGAKVFEGKSGQARQSGGIIFIGVDEAGRQGPVRDYFVFDLSGADGTEIASAKLTIIKDGFAPPAEVTRVRPEIVDYSLYGYQGSISSFREEPIVNPFLDTGRAYARLAIDHARITQDTKTIEIALSPAAVADINERLATGESLFAIIGQCTSCEIGKLPHWVHASGEIRAQLDVEYANAALPLVPLMVALVASAVGWIALTLRRTIDELRAKIEEIKAAP